ncbi:hypothetical protein BC831DRAFT_459481 [Entophlyctis helioformis]|nr:hypothetical protein BC831DRAFT_459481 [Entophlyctis helioformis]
MDGGADGGDVGLDGNTSGADGGQADDAGGEGIDGEGNGINGGSGADGMDGEAGSGHGGEGSESGEFSGKLAGDADADADQAVDQHEQQYIEQMARRKHNLRQQLLDKKKVPASYYTNSPKEQIILQYVDNFSRQYCQLYPGRKELLLSPPNEFGIKKFVSTTIRPTQLPYKELYDYRSCAAFVADFIAYEPLEPPHELPKTIVSPTYTLKMQSGTCFDLSILLSSLLRGVGYDAYVVSGYASRNITLMDQTKTSVEEFSMRVPGSSGGIVGMTNSSTAGPGTAARDSRSQGDGIAMNKYRVKPPRQLKSSFLAKQEERQKQLLLKKDADAEKAHPDPSTMAQEDDDELKGLRIHAWVLVLPGKREVAESFFIEPSTGKIYSTENENYLGLESVFSSQNYWVNMQVCYDGLKGISFDIGDNAKWEFVFLDNTQPGGMSSKRNDLSKADGNGSDEEEEEENSSEVVDLTPSWVDRLGINKEQFELRCPSGTKVTIYKNARWEKFAEYHRADGMVSRITYVGQDNSSPSEIHEIFENRRDKLLERIRVPATKKIHELFNPGRIPHGLKEHILVDGKTTEMHFYPSARSDGLVKRIESSRKVMEFFTEREDRLVYRSVTYDVEDGLRGGVIKMAEKFSRNLELSAQQDVYKKTYFAKEERIRIIFHLEEGRIIASMREFRKPSSDQKGHFVELTNSFEVNPYVTQPKRQHLYAHLLDLLRTEQACAQAIKNAERELSDILQLRQSEEREVSLTISVYDTLRNDTKLPTDDDGKDVHKGDEEETKTVDLDYLSPFLINYENPNHLTREEALAVKDSCLKSLKERLVEKANIIQGRLDEVTTEYQKRQLAYSRNADSMTAEETDDYVRFCNDALFRIHILEKRLAKHKETAPERYIELDSRLRSDNRLSAAFQTGYY